MDDTLEVNALDSEQGFFDDYEPTSEELAELSDEPSEPQETETVEEPTEETTEETIEETAEPANPFELRVKFNGEERTLSEEEARTLAQKGMNYDRFYEPIERLARMNGLSVGDYVNQLNDTQMRYEVEKEIETLREDPKYENVSDEVLEEIANSHVKEFMGQRDQYYADQDKKQADEEQARVQREVDLFMQEYPEFKDKSPDALDPKVFEYVKQGYTLLEAYGKFLRLNSQKSQIEAKAKVSKLNETNKQKSIGNTTNAGSSEVDPFMNGFFNS